MTGEIKCEFPHGHGRGSSSTAHSFDDTHILSFSVLEAGLRVHVTRDSVEMVSHVFLVVPWLSRSDRFFRRYYTVCLNMKTGKLIDVDRWVRDSQSRLIT
jgi:hypothetical protein